MSSLTRDLFYRGIETGYLLYQDRQGRSLRIPTPWNVENLLRQTEGGMTGESGAVADLVVDS